MAVEDVSVLRVSEHGSSVTGKHSWMLWGWGSLDIQLCPLLALDISCCSFLEMKRAEPLGCRQRTWVYVGMCGLRLSPLLFGLRRAYLLPFGSTLSDKSHFAALQPRATTSGSLLQLAKY